MFDTETAVHDKLLAEILAESSGASLKVIIGSIQKEQNDAIRNHYCKYLLIHGLAGSGKTSVGLHRMAYILYKHKETVRPENILILSNNNIFKTYISSVLPELGENNIYIKPFGEIYKKHLPESYEAETYYGLIEALSKSPGRAAETAFKNSAAFLDFLLGYFEGYGYIFEDVRYENDIIVAKETFYANAEKNFGVTISRARALIRDRSADYFRRHMKEIKLKLEKEQAGYLLERELDAIFRRLKQDFIEGELKKLELNNRLDEIALYRDILGLYAGEKNKGVYLSALFRLEEGRLGYEDLMIILCIKQIIGKIRPETDILHVLVDEAQDCGIFQLWFLKNQYPKSFFTLLGDANQSVEPEAGISDWAALEKVFGRELESLRLFKCYRSSGPISALAFRLIGAEGTGAEYYDRKGEKPRYIQTEDAGKTVLRLLGGLAGRYLTIGIITPAIDEAESLYAELRAGLGESVRLLADPGSKLSGRITVLPLMLAKGLEFDAAICVNLMNAGGNPDKCRKTAYLAGSRALHALYFICTEPFPELFDDCRELMLLEQA
jgi:DNA helicase-2/ATP-dependent DNA helicase PcrA